MNVLNYFCRMFLTLLWMSWGGLWCLEECFGWVGVDRQFLWVCRGRWRYISSGWGGWTFFLGCMGMSGGEWRYILGGWRWVDIYGKMWVGKVGWSYVLGGWRWVDIFMSWWGWVGIGAGTFWVGVESGHFLWVCGGSWGWVLIYSEWM